MPKVSVIVPVYNAERYVANTIQSVLSQTYTDFELLIIDDGSPDNSITICRQFKDPRIRIISQSNRGLAGARNTGIRHATGDYLAFLDADDLWKPEKLERQVAHLDHSPHVGISYTQSVFIDATGQSLDIYQIPKQTGITPYDVFCRNPISNGSTPMIRRAVLEAICYPDNYYGTNEDFYFDETFRQCEDIECWIRIYLTTRDHYCFEGIPEVLTLYRVNNDGLSANLWKHLEAWERVFAKTYTYAPEVTQQWMGLAKAYILRYLARRAVQLRDSKLAIQLINQALATDLRILSREPQRTLITLLAAYLLWMIPSDLYKVLEKGTISISSWKKKWISRGA